MSSLYVLLPAPGVEASALSHALSPDGVSAGTASLAPIHALPRPGGTGAEVIAIVPAAALSWHRVELPRGTPLRASRTRTVLEGLLEDRVLDDIEQLHFALAPGARAGEPLWVAACHLPWLRQALQTLEAAGLPVDRIVPEAVPADAPALQATGTPEDPVLIATGPRGVVSLPLSSATLPLLHSVGEGAADAPLSAEPAVAGLAEHLLQRPPTLTPAPARWLAAAASGWDLAQFALARAGRAGAARRAGAAWITLVRDPRWRPARWGAIALVVAQVLGLNAWAWKERHALDDKQTAIRRALTDTFPQVKVVIDPVVQMGKELALLQQGSGATSAGDLEALLAEVGGALPPGRAATTLEFTPGQLRLRGLELGPDEAQAFSGQLRARGLEGTAQGDTWLVRAEAAR